MVEFIYRCGDITSSSNGTLSKEAMNAGSKMHRKLQKMAGSYYDAEVPLKITMKKGIHDLDVTIEGRADGIIDLRGEKNRSRKKKEIERQVIRVEDRYWDRLLLKKTESPDPEAVESLMEPNAADVTGQMPEQQQTDRQQPESCDERSFSYQNTPQMYCIIFQPPKAMRFIGTPANGFSISCTK